MEKQIIKVFVSHSFDNEKYKKGLGDFRMKIKDSINQGVLMSQHSNLSIDLNIYFQGDEFGRSLPNQIRSEMDAADFAIVDITGFSPNVCYELGYLMSKNKKIIVIANSSSSTIPADIQDILIGYYRSIDELLRTISIQTANIISEIIENKTKLLELNFNRCFWFPKPVKNIHIVCGPEPEKSRFANPLDSNFVYIDNLEDRDSLLQISMFLSRAFPEASIYRHSSDLFQPDLLSQNLVILGGPGDDIAGNKIAKEFMDAMKLRVGYSEDCENMIVDGVEYLSKYSSSKLVTDWGYFAKFKNPYNPKASVVMCQGLHTAGTLGASIVLSDETDSQKNRQTLKEKFELSDTFISDIPDFDVIFQVQVIAGNRILCPKIKANNIGKIG